MVAGNCSPGRAYPRRPSITPRAPPARVRAGRIAGTARDVEGDQLAVALADLLPRTVEGEHRQCRGGELAAQLDRGVDVAVARQLPSGWRQTGSVADI